MPLPFSPKEETIKKHTKSRKILPLLLNPLLDPQQQRRLPLIKLTQLIVLEQFIRKRVLVALLDGFGQVNEELVLARRLEGGVEVAVGV